MAFYERRKHLIVSPMWAVQRLLKFETRTKLKA